MPFYRGDPDRNYPADKSKRPPEYRKLPKNKFFSTAGGEDHVAYNPTITLYYADTNENELVRVEETVRLSDTQMSKYAQTISGSNYSQQWPNYDHYVVFNPWEYTTYSG